MTRIITLLVFTAVLSLHPSISSTNDKAMEKNQKAINEQESDLESTNSAQKEENRINLQALRNALSFFYGDKMGRYPSDPQKELVPRFLAVIPVLVLPHHTPTNKIRIITKSYGKPLTTFVRDTGQWLYMADKNNNDMGTIIIDCTHSDIRERQWSNY